jgi:succinate dehydrogenase/fumarate reductase cytochrome b subunit
MTKKGAIAKINHSISSRLTILFLIYIVLANLIIPSSTSDSFTGNVMVIATKLEMVLFFSILLSEIYERVVNKIDSKNFILKLAFLIFMYVVYYSYLVGYWTRLTDLHILK